MFTKLYDWNDKPNTQEIEAVKTAMLAILNGETDTPSHLCGQNSYIAEELAKKYPNADKEIIGRVVYLCRRSIRDEEQAADGFAKPSLDLLAEWQMQGRKIALKHDGILGKSVIELRPKNGVWIIKGKRTRGFTSVGLLGEYVKALS